MKDELGSVEFVNQKIRALKYKIASVSSIAKEGHVPSAYSILDILWVLYHDVMKVTGQNELESDKFILSKGHASLALYAIFLSKKIISVEEFESFCSYDSKFGGHPDSRKCPYIEVSTGSLGHGLPVAVGMAMSSVISSRTNRIFCLIGDGECNEGTIWESAMLAAHHRLGNLTCIVDYNHSTDRALKLGEIDMKFKEFGWGTQCVDGHNHADLRRALLKSFPDQPNVIVANTVKGKGVRSMENEPAWHHKSPTAAELKSILTELS